MVAGPIRSKGVGEGDAVKLHVMLFDLPAPARHDVSRASTGDFDFPQASGEREVFIYHAYRKPGRDLSRAAACLRSRKAAAQGHAGHLAQLEHEFLKAIA